MVQSKAHKQATARYEARTYDKFMLRLRKDGDLTRETIAAAAARAEESMQGYIMEAVKRRINAEKNNE